MDTVQDLTRQIRAMVSQIEALTGDGGDGDRDRIEKYLAEFTTRIGVLLTIAALLTGLALAQTDFLKIFLKTSFPLFLVGIIFYLLSARRVNFVTTAWSQQFQLVIHDSYRRTRMWHLMTDITLVGFFVAFTVSIYLHTFGHTMSPADIVCSYVCAALAALLRYLYITWIPNLGGNGEMVATGGHIEDFPMIDGKPVLGVGGAPGGDTFNLEK